MPPCAIVSTGAINPPRALSPACHVFPRTAPVVPPPNIFAFLAAPSIPELSLFNLEVVPLGSVAN